MIDYPNGARSDSCAYPFDRGTLDGCRWNAVGFSDRVP